MIKPADEQGQYLPVFFLKVILSYRQHLKQEGFFFIIIIFFIAFNVNRY